MEAVSADGRHTRMAMWMKIQRLFNFGVEIRCAVRGVWSVHGFAFLLDDNDMI
jgi:hypothetical protein